MNKKIMGCSIGNCVHVAGVANFFRLADTRGFDTILLGAAVSPDRLANEVFTQKPDILCVGYRLTPENGQKILLRLIRLLQNYTLPIKKIFGGTPKTVALAKQLDFFDYFFIGEESIDRLESVFSWLKGGDFPAVNSLATKRRPAVQLALDSLPMINNQGMQMPLLRHHFGLPRMQDTIDGVTRIAESEALDIISLAPDQNAQEFFFRPEEQNSSLNGAGGFPVRNKSELLELNLARKYGNYPYLKIYSGTQDLLSWAQLSCETIDNAWGTIPLCWYSELDGRSKRPLETAITENIDVIKWYASVGKPVEINEAHHWSLRDAPDVIAIVMAYIAAYIAKKSGVKQYIAQYMFNNPSFTSMPHDIAKMAVKTMLVQSLEDDSFRTYRQLRAGLAHFSIDLDVAKGQIGAATSMMMAFNPHILHVVGFTEGDHAANAEEVIESCKITRGVIKNISYGLPNIFADKNIKNKAISLFKQSQILLNAIRLFGYKIGSEDPLSDPKVISESIKKGILDAPHLRGQPCALGSIKTLPWDGGCVATDQNGNAISEQQRLAAPMRQLGIDPRELLDFDPLFGKFSLPQLTIS
ncbi:hypothetical protein [Desulfoplanes formicivorans]|uniref:Methionine synthase n=1 Tax=Desulfoplanes formicivorans TaxID=1592317 RepID=A0A194ABT6_9BACT|nr:hypothetical protein [Desulfoplanes formicivorans]GAU07617.1 methionine synthase [Desulfoplanes formicivorans]